MKSLTPSFPKPIPRPRTFSTTNSSQNCPDNHQKPFQSLILKSTPLFPNLAPHLLYVPPLHQN